MLARSDHSYRRLCCHNDSMVIWVFMSVLLHACLPLCQPQSIYCIIKPALTVWLSTLAVFMVIKLWNLPNCPLDFFITVFWKKQTGNAGKRDRRDVMQQRPKAGIKQVTVAAMQPWLLPLPTKYFNFVLYTHVNLWRKFYLTAGMSSLPLVVLGLICRSPLPFSLLFSCFSIFHPVSLPLPSCLFVRHCPFLGRPIGRIWKKL